MTSPMNTFHSYFLAIFNSLLCLDPQSILKSDCLCQMYSSHSVGFRFARLMVSLAAQKRFSLVRSRSSIIDLTF